MVQVFHFLTDTLESYHCRKLISVSNNRLDSYIALKFKGLHAAKISKECIQQTECKNVYIVQSKTDRTMSYTVDMIVGVCTCPQGIDGSPCLHQAAVSIHYGRASINCIPTISPKVRQIYAQIAIGDKASTNISFYGSLHSNVSNCEDTDMFHADFNSLSFDLIRAGARDDSINAKVSESQSEDYRQRAQNACLQISTIANDLKEKLEGTTNEQLLFGVEKFVSRYSKLKNSVPLLTSSLHRFGWTFGGTITSNKGGHLRYGRRIAVQATAAERRKGKSRGK